jgi:DNA-binding CsgD family transcriptional regulator
MRHLVLAFYLLALTAGTAALSQTLLLWQRWRRTLIRRWGLFLLALWLILLGFLVDLYGQVAMSVPAARPGSVPVIVWILQAAGGMLYVFTGPSFFHALAGRTVGRGARAVYYAVDAVVVAAAVVNVAAPRWLPATWALSGILFAMIAYGIIFIAVHLGGIGDRLLRRAIVIFLSLSAVFFPLMLVDSLMELVPFLHGLAFMENLAQPLYFFVLNCLTVVLGLRWLDRPAYAERDGLTEYFLTAFGISPRESEIIGLLLEGAGTKVIGQKLFISSKTAENHVYNIYQKLKVRNRVQLFQLIRTNSIE